LAPIWHLPVLEFGVSEQGGCALPLPLQALPRSGHIAVSTKVLGRIRLVRPELHPGGYHEAAIKQVVDSAPASALVPRMEETTIGQLDPTLSSDVCARHLACCRYLLLPLLYCDDQ
jgi:hypothetical protein